MRKTANQGRDIYYLNFLKDSLQLYYIKSLSILDSLRLTFLALVCSCQSNIATEDDMGIYLKSAQVILQGPPIETLDVFLFEDKQIRVLDSYQRIDDVTGWEIQAGSRKGEKIAFAVANGHWNKDEWMGVNSYESLRGYKAELEKESGSYPVMCGECRLTADGAQTVWMEMERLCSQVELRSISCDFTGKQYEDKGIEELKAYLINVNAQCSIMPEEVVMPERIINMGGLDEDDMNRMKEPELLLQYGSELRSGKSLDTRFKFGCYPNSCPEESLGSPFTRLVIEGKIDGQTYYWSINVGREMDGRGIERNHRYVYEVTITGKGSDSPDIPVSSEMLSSKIEILKWEEKDEYVICY